VCTGEKVARVRLCVRVCVGGGGRGRRNACDGARMGWMQMKPASPAFLNPPPTHTLSCSSHPPPMTLTPASPCPALPRPAPPHQHHAAACHVGGVQCADEELIVGTVDGVAALEGHHVSVGGQYGTHLGGGLAWEHPARVGVGAWRGGGELGVARLDGSRVWHGDAQPQSLHYPCRIGLVSGCSPPPPPPPSTRPPTSWGGRGRGSCPPGSAHPAASPPSALLGAQARCFRSTPWSP
jgi:hypothetical protein